MEEKNLSVYRAARMFGVPESTLRDRHLGNQPADTVPTSGPSPMLSLEEEKGLVEHVSYMAKIGYGYSKQAFLDLSTEFARSLGKKAEGDPSFKHSWYAKFVKRWPELHLAKTEKLAIVRAKATSQEVLDGYFSELEQVIHRNKLQDHPEHIWNVDESGITMEHTPLRVLCERGLTPQGITSSRGKNVTVIGCGNAAGNHVPPYFIFPGKRWNNDFLDGTCPGASGEMSESGWSNSQTFMNFLGNHFRRSVPANANYKDLILFVTQVTHFINSQ